MGRAHKKHNHAANLNLILNELRLASPTGGLTLKQLSELCGVSKRNIYRYLNELEEIGFDLIRPVQPKPGQVGVGRYQLRKKTMPETKVDTNLMMLIGLYAQRELQYREHLKIINEFFIRYLAAKYNLSLPPYWSLPTVSVKDFQDNKEKNNAKAILNIHVNKDKLNKKQQEIVKVIISPSAAAIYRQQHDILEPLHLHELTDGSLLLTYNLTSENDILPWIFQWGAEAEIIEPRRLRKKMTDLCNAIIKAHRYKYLSKKILYMQSTKII